MRGKDRRCLGHRWQGYEGIYLSLVSISSLKEEEEREQGLIGKDE